MKGVGHLFGKIRESIPFDAYARSLILPAFLLVLIPTLLITVTDIDIFWSFATGTLIAWIFQVYNVLRFEEGKRKSFLSLRNERLSLSWWIVIQEKLTSSLVYFERRFKIEATRRGKQVEGINRLLDYSYGTNDIMYHFTDRREGTNLSIQTLASEEISNFLPDTLKRLDRDLHKVTSFFDLHTNEKELTLSQPLSEKERDTVAEFLVEQKPQGET